MSRCFLCLSLLCLTLLGGYAQIDTTRKESKFGMHQLGIGVNLIPTINALAKGSGSGFAMNGFVSPYKNTFLNFDYGIENTEINDDLMQYNQEGNYIRLGAQIGFVAKKNRPEAQDDFFLVGLHYGMANGVQNVPYYKVVSPVYDYSAPPPITDDKYKFSWIAISLGLRGRIVKNLFVGVFGDLNFRRSSDFNVTPDIVPGFGNGFRGTNMRLGYYINFVITKKREKTTNFENIGKKMEAK